MAKDYYKHNTLDEFELLVKNNNAPFYPTGKTGYERYYIDLQGFWRQIYNPCFERDIKKYQDKRKQSLSDKEFVQGFIDNVNLSMSDASQIRYINSRYDGLIKYDKDFEYQFFS
jgi:hypothetical protein